jgi:hypothetical protein
LRPQVYFNGHGWLARQLAEAGIAFELNDNAFVTLPDEPAARRLTDGLDATTLHRHLGAWAQRFGPVLRQQAKFQPRYAAIIRTAVHVTKAEHVATFLGRKLTGAYPGYVSNDFSTRIQGTRIRHHMGPANL